MKSARKIGIICLLAVVLVSTGPVTGYSFTHDDNFGRNDDQGYVTSNGNRVYYAGSTYPYPYSYYGPPPAYYGPPVSVVIPFPVYGPGYWGGYHHRHHRHWR